MQKKKKKRATPATRRDERGKVKTAGGKNLQTWEEGKSRRGGCREWMAWSRRKDTLQRGTAAAYLKARASKAGKKNGAPQQPPTKGLFTPPLGPENGGRRTARPGIKGKERQNDRDEEDVPAEGDFPAGSRPKMVLSKKEEEGANEEGNGYGLQNDR